MVDHWDSNARMVACDVAKRRAGLAPELGRLPRQRVRSSYLRSLGFERGLLEVEFQNGDVFRYQRVKPAVFETIMAAKSIGSAFRTLDKAGALGKGERLQ